MVSARSPCSQPSSLPEQSASWSLGRWRRQP